MGIGFTAKAKNEGGSSTTSEHQNWGMGFLLVFFPEEDSTTIINMKKNQSNNTGLLSSSSSLSSPSSKPINTLLKRTKSAHLLSRAQSTISICALLIFITLLLFTLSTFEPSTSHHFSPRRQLVSQLSTDSHFKKFKNSPPANAYSSVLSHALQGMGTLYRRGTRAMNDLIVAHVVESLTVHELRLFSRVLHRSALTSRSDLLFIFPSKSTSFDTTILEENHSFLQLIDHYQELSSKTNSLNSTGGFDANQFVKWGKQEKESGQEPLWGRRIRSNLSEGNVTESTRLSYGSVVAFDVDELDPENSLAGFMDHVPMSLRRWACYPMLLGRVRRNFKHIMLVDAKEMLVFGDPFSRVRSMSPESVYLTAATHSSSSRHGKRNSDKTQSTHSKSVSPAIIAGGARGVRRLSSAMLTEIARTAMQHKKKNPVTESALFNQLVGNEFLLKNVNLITSREPIPELSSLARLKSKPGSSLVPKFTVVRRGNSNFDVNSTALKHIVCSESPPYGDC